MINATKFSQRDARNCSDIGILPSCPVSKGEGTQHSRVSLGWGSGLPLPSHGGWIRAQLWNFSKSTAGTHSAGMAPTQQRHPLFRNFMLTWILVTLYKWKTSLSSWYGRKKRGSINYSILLDSLSSFPKLNDDNVLKMK